MGSICKNRKKKMVDCLQLIQYFSFDISPLKKGNEAMTHLLRDRAAAGRWHQWAAADHIKTGYVHIRDLIKIIPSSHDLLPLYSRSYAYTYVSRYMMTDYMCSGMKSFLKQHLYFSCRCILAKRICIGSRSTHEWRKKRTLIWAVWAITVVSAVLVVSVIWKVYQKK